MGNSTVMKEVAHCKINKDLIDLEELKTNDFRILRTYVYLGDEEIKTSIDTLQQWYQHPVNFKGVWKDVPIIEVD